MISAARVFMSILYNEPRLLAGRRASFPAAER